MQRRNPAAGFRPLQNNDKKKRSLYHWQPGAGLSRTYTTQRITLSCLDYEDKRKRDRDRNNTTGSEIRRSLHFSLFPHTSTHPSMYRDTCLSIHTNHQQSLKTPPYPHYHPHNYRPSLCITVAIPMFITRKKKLKLQNQCSKIKRR